MTEETKIMAKTSGIKGKDKIGYAMGDVASLLVFGLVNTFLQVFYTESLGITPLIVMLIMILARVWDAINDPIWGRIVDKSKCKTPGKKYKRWLAYLCIPLAVSAILMFLNVKKLGFSHGLTIAYATCSYIIFGMLYTGTSIPYGSMASVITTDEKERNSLSIFRSVGSTIGGFGPMILSFLCYDKVKNDAGETFSVLNSDKLLIGVIILSVLCVGAFFVCYFMSKERVIVEHVEEKKVDEVTGEKKSGVIKSLIKNKAFVTVSIVGMLFLAAQMFQTTYNAYVFMKFFGNGGLAALTTICQYLPVAVVMFLSGKLVRKFGRKEICAIGLLFVAISFGILAVIPTASIDKNVLMWMFIGFSFLGGIGNSFIFLMIWALANDAIDDYFVKTKRHDEATAYALFSFMRKLGQTIAAIVVNVSLISLGYGKTEEFVVTEAQAKGMYYQSIIIPAALSLVMFLLLWFVYPLGKKQIEELQVMKKEIYNNEKK